MNPPSSPFGQPDAVRLSDEDATIAVLERAVTGMWDAVSELTRLRRTSRQNYRVTIFGSARIKPGTPAYDSVKQLATALAEMGCDIISGGGPGLMQAANEGALSADPEALRRSVGIRVDLPFEQEINPFVGQAYAHRTFFSRLHHFMIASDAFIVVPGESGPCWKCRLPGSCSKSGVWAKPRSFLSGKCGRNWSDGGVSGCCGRASNSRARPISTFPVAWIPSKPPSR
jgi:hypothetical protein